MTIASTVVLGMGTISQALLGTALFTAAILKLTSTKELGSTLVAIGLPAKAAPTLALVVIGTEAGAAVTLIALPGAPWPRIITGFLALAFASVGIRTLAAGRR